jgi:hypothetical protein
MTTLFKLLAPAQRSLHIKQGKIIIIIIILPAPTNYRIANCVTKSLSHTSESKTQRRERRGFLQVRIPPLPLLKEQA